MTGPVAQNQSIAATDATHEKGGAPVGGRLENFDMLSIAEKPDTGKTKGATVAKFHTVSDGRKAALWLDDHVAKAGNVVTSIVADLTPELAAVLLERNPANRSLKRTKVEDYAKDMKTGAWKFNGEPIIVASDGLLNDGQHRCAAVIESRRSVKAVFVFGVERETRDTLDQGANRTSADYLSIHGHTDTNHLSGAARCLWQWRTYGFISDGSTFRPTRSEIVDTVDDNPGLKKSLEIVSRRGSSAFSSRSVLAFCHFAFKSVATEKDIAAGFFMDCLIDGANLKSGDPILYVRNRLIADRKSLRMPEKAELLFRAWNAHRLAQTRVLIRVAGGELPILEA